MVIKDPDGLHPMPVDGDNMCRYVIYRRLNLFKEKATISRDSFRYYGRHPVFKFITFENLDESINEADSFLKLNRW